MRSGFKDCDAPAHRKVVPNRTSKDVDRRVPRDATGAARWLQRAEAAGIPGGASNAPAADPNTTSIDSYSGLALWRRLKVPKVR